MGNGVLKVISSLGVSTVKRPSAAHAIVGWLILEDSDNEAIKGNRGSSSFSFVGLFSG